MENKNLDGQISLDSQLAADGRSKAEEFQIGKPKEEENLVFEVSKVKEEEKTSGGIEEPIVEEFVLGATPELKEEQTNVAADESAASPEPSVESAVPQKKIPVYIPRFTEASDKYRKMIDTRTFSAAKDPRVMAKNAATADDVEDVIDYSDPTAEIDFAPKNQVFVNVTSPEPDSEMLNVYKFTADKAEEEAPEEEETAEPTLEEEREAILRLIGKDISDNAVDTPEEPSAEEVFSDNTDVDAEEEDSTGGGEEQTEQTALTQAEDYSLPDPVDQVHIEEFPDVVPGNNEEPVPDCVVEDEPLADKKGMLEFTHQAQRDGFKDRFLDSIMAIKVRLGAIGIFSLILLVFEWLASGGVISANVFEGSDSLGTLAAFDWLFVASIFALTIPETVRAVKHLIGGRLIPEISLLAQFIAVSLYLLIAVLIPEAEYPLFGFIFAISALSAAFSTYFRTIGDFTAFKQVSQNTAKKVLDVKLTRELDDENAALDGLIDEYNSKTSRIYKAAFVTDFFKRANESVVNNERTAFMLGIPAAAALVTGAVCFFIPGGAVSAFAAFALVFLIGCPAFAVLSNKISYFDSQDAVLDEESAIIGEKSYMDFAEVDVIAFEDTEIFGTDDVKLKRFMLYGNRDNIEKAMRQMYSLFSVVGGPLYNVFSNALDNRVRHAPATDVEMEADGACGNISGARIYAGNDEYMRRHGIPLPSTSSSTEFGADTTKILYAAEGGEVYAKFYIRYSFSEEFTMLLPALKKEGIVPLIYTNDPNLSNELLKTLSAGADYMRVVKKFIPRVDSDKTYRRVSAGVVTYGDKINAINTILLTRKYKEFSEKVAIYELYSMSIAAAIAALLSVFGVGLPSVVFGLWHIIGCVALRFISRRSFILEKKEDN